MSTATNIQTSGLTLDPISASIIDVNAITEESTQSEVLRTTMWHSLAEANLIQDNNFKLQKGQGDCISAVMLKLAQGIWIENEKDVLAMVKADPKCKELLEKSGQYTLDIIPFGGMPQLVKCLFGSHISDLFVSEYEANLEEYTKTLEGGGDFKFETNGNAENCKSILSSAMQEGINLVVRESSGAFKHDTRQKVAKERKALKERIKELAEEERRLVREKVEADKKAARLETPEGQMENDKAQVVNLFTSMVNSIGSVEQFKHFQDVFLAPTLEKFGNNLINNMVITDVQLQGLKDKVYNLANPVEAKKVIDTPVSMEV